MDTASAVITVSCQVDIPAVKGLKDQELTVGREFFLNCKGEWPKNLVQEKLQILVPEKAKYQIHLLSFEFRSAEEADLKVTAYQAVPVKLEGLQLTDGTQSVTLSPVQYNVRTVIEKPKDPQQKVEPYGPFGPAMVPIPGVYFLIVLVVVLLAFLLIGQKTYRISQRRKLLRRLKEHDSALSPLAQFHQSMRRLQRENAVFYGAAFDLAQVHEGFKTLSEMWSLFLTRQFLVPAQEWNDKLILKDIRKYHREIFAETGVEIKKLLNEYAQAARSRDKLTDKDILVFAEQTRRLVEKLDRIKNQGRRS